MWIYESLAENMLSLSGINDVLMKVRFYLKRGEEMKEEMEEKLRKYNAFLYLFFFAPNLPESCSTVGDLANSLNLILETHTVHTKDGYIIQVHRIPGTGPPVLLQHGLMCTSACWLTSGKSSIACMLHNAGYDVWLGNLRGNSYGCEHAQMVSSNPTFWKFTFHHFGKYDIPATVDKVLAVSGYSNLSYIGHSMGSTSILVSASQSPEVFSRLNLVILLAPVTAGHNMTSPIKRLAGLHRHQRSIMEWLGVYSLPPKIPGAGFIASRPLFPLFSDTFLNLIEDGFIGSQEIVFHLPSTVSTYTLLHFSQTISERTFSGFDWGSSEDNIEQYGQPEPPVYHVDKLSTPTAIFSAKHDTLSPPSELDIFCKTLPNLVFSRVVDISHLGFLWGANASHLVYSPIINLLKTYSSPKIAIDA
jgi:pimeloyl-ACP methyl ester carboxylesterase